MSDGGFDLAEDFAHLANEGLRERTRALGGVAVRLVRLPGGSEGQWDSHDHPAETAIVWSGDCAVAFHDRTLQLGPGQGCVVAAGEAHRGSSKAGAELILLTNVTRRPSAD